MEIQYQYTQIKSKILNLCQILVFITQSNRLKKSYPLNTIDPQPPPSSTYKINGWALFHKSRLYNTFRRKWTCVLGHDRPIQLPIRLSKGQSGVFKSLTTLSPDQWLLNHQGSILVLYESPLMANKWPYGGGSYPSAEVQSAYSTAPADRASVASITCHHLWLTGVPHEEGRGFTPLQVFS